MIRIELPYHLRNLARVSGEVEVDLGDVPASIGTVMDALEARYPMLCGTVRDHGTDKRRAFLRFFVCGEDWSNEPHDKPLPDAISTGKEPFLIIGAIAGG